MADENKTGKLAFEDLALAFFAILIVGQIFQRGPAMLAERWGIEFGGGEDVYLVAGAELSAETSVGSAVNVPNGGTYFDEPGEDGGNIGVFAPGTSLVIVEGPQTEGGERWWRVRDTLSGETGWVPESILVREGVGGVGPGTRVGATARALLDTSAWDSPGGFEKTGELKMGTWGELTKGPERANGSWWWFFDGTETDIDGWVPEAALVLSSDSGWETGTIVSGTKTVDMYTKAGDGEIIGLLQNGEKATILGGPIEAGSEIWWYIESENGERGWVREVDIQESGVRGFLKVTVTVIMVIGGLLTLLLLGGIMYVTIRTNQIRAKETQRIMSAIPKEIEPMRNERWEKIQEHVNSDNPNDWRHAIIEADILLDEVVTKIGYEGDTLGEKLKKIVQGDMSTLDNAWEAHKTRNQIAHEGSDYILTQREAKRVIELYASVFNEFKTI